MKILLILLSVLFFAAASAQKKNDFVKVFQFSLAPGLGTNGLHPGSYTNYFSLNLTSGYSSGNYLVEIGGISNLNESETRGVQFAGLVNMTGANAFAGLRPKDIEKKKREGFEANLSGGQFSGLANVVLNNVFGWQASAGFNVSKGALQGFQLAGISNTVYKYSFAVQLAGAYNVSVESMDGVQIATLFNITTGGFFGLQIGMFNKSGYMQGINSYDSSDPTAVQIGLVNTCGKMNGYQIGLVNVGGTMQGTQIGLINFYHGEKMPQTKDGTSIGLLNIGSTGYISVYASDVFYANVEIATGTIKNKRIAEDAWEKQIQNGLIYSNDPGFAGSRERWAVGYSLKKFYFRRPAIGRNKLNFFSGGVEWMHINHERKQWTKEWSLLSRPVLSVGSKLHPRNRICYFFASLAYNVYYSASGAVMNSSAMKENQASELQHWPGFSGGIMIQ